MAHPDRPTGERLPFSDATRSVLEVVRAHAVEDQRDIVGLEYVVGGLLTDERVATTLSSLGVDSEGLALAIDGMREKGDARFIYEEDGTEQILLGPRATYATRRAREIATIAGKNHVDPIDMLQGVVTDTHWKGAPILERFGVTPQSVGVAAR